MVRPVHSRDDLQHYLAHRWQVMPEWEVPLDTVLAEDATVPSGTDILRWVFDDGTAIRGSSNLLGMFWSALPNAHRLSILAVDREPAQALLATAEQAAKERASTHLEVWHRDSMPVLTQVFEENGYGLRQVNPEVRVDLEGFDPQAWQDPIAACQAAGLTLLTGAEYLELRGEQALRQMYELDCEVTRDIPNPTPIELEPFENWAGQMQVHGHAWPFWHLALDGDQIAGLTMLFPNKCRPEFASTGLTGVRRHYRRRGIATAIKAAALTKAKASGIRFVLADNEENNPMRQLNLALGFQTFRNIRVYGKDL